MRQPPPSTTGRQARPVFGKLRWQKAWYPAVVTRFSPRSPHAWTATGARAVVPVGVAGVRVTGTGRTGTGVGRTATGDGIETGEAHLIGAAGSCRVGAGPVDVGMVGAGTLDVGTLDVGTFDVGMVDMDMGMVDMGMFDIGTVDKSTVDISTVDISTVRPDVAVGWGGT